MFSLICPHMGGIVEPEGELLICPFHRWKFSRRTGESVVGSKGLREICVHLEDDLVMAEIGNSPEARWGSTESVECGGSADPEVRIQLLAHACLQIRYRGFSLITDPWLDGPAFHGAWTQYPPAVCGARDIRADAVLITHEHSDHCHSPSLAQLDRDVPIYFPAFPNGRIDRLICDLGFRNRTPMLFGRPYGIGENISVTCFDPTGNWNDSIHLIDLGGWRILNLNDAGVNYRIADLVQPVNLICSSFSSGASGFPMCWTHIRADECESILRQQISARRDMLEHAARVYGCSRVLLFASYFALNHPQHRRYQELLSRTKLTAAAIRAYLAEREIEALDLLPGESWSNLSGEIERRGYPAELFSWATVSDALEKRFREAEFEQHHPSGQLFDERRVVAYFLGLGKLPEIRQVRDYTFGVHATNAGRGKTLSFRIADGTIERVSDQAPCNLRIEIPLNVLMHIVLNEGSWDEAYIGYWCRFHDENPYNVSFWRLLQAPYYLRTGDREVTSGPVPEEVHETTSIGAILESRGELAARIISRHGMYCVGCERTPMETLAAGARKHGLDDSELRELVDELNDAGALGPAPRI